MWVTDGSPELKIDGNEVTADVKQKGDVHNNVMWVDGTGINDGEHYWTFKFGALDSPHIAIGLTNEERFGPGYKLGGLMYGGNLHNGGCLLVGQFGPGIHSNDTIGLLATFTEEAGKLLIYLYENGQPMGLAFNVDASVLPNARPAIRFSTGKAAAKIQKEVTIPGNRTRTPKTFTGLEGPWKLILSLVQMEGQSVASRPGLERMEGRVTIKFTKEGDAYHVFLKVINSISFKIERTEGSWKNLGEASTTLVGSSPQLLNFEQEMTSLCKNPSSVLIGEGDGMLTIEKSNSRANFGRHDDHPGPFNGNPFS